MTVVHPNAVSGINSITVQTGNSLSIHKSDGSLIRTITGTTGVTTFATISVGSATTDFAQGGGINIGLGASISNGSGNVLTFGTNGDDRLNITSAGLVQVGLSGMTGGDDHALVVNNPSNDNKVLELSTSNATGRINFGRTLSDTLNTTAYIEWGEPGAQGTGDLKFGTSGGSNNPTESFRIDSSGRLLHGATASRSIADGTPNLQVEGTAGTASLGLVRNQNNSGGSNISFAKSRSGSLGGSTIVQDDDTLGSINFAGADGTDINTRAASIIAEVDGTPGANDMPGRLVFNTTADGANSVTERLRITSAGLVGINVTPASGHLLHIKDGSADAKLKIESESGYDARLILDTSNGGGAGGHIDFQIDGTLKGGIQYVSNASASDTHDIIFRNNSNTERFRIASDGKVGINSTTPTFSAGGGVQLRGSGSDFTSFRVSASSNTGVDFSQASDGIAYVYNRDNNDLILGTNNGERARIKAAGELLIGHSNVLGHSGVNGYLQVTGTTTNTTSITQSRFSNDHWCPFITMAKSRSGTKGTQTVVQANDYLGYLNFAGSDGTDFNNPAAYIAARVDGTPGANDMPGRLEFATTADGANSATERLRITSAGAWGIAGANYGTDGQVLTSGGSGAAVAWEDAGGGLFSRAWYDMDTSETTITGSSGETRVGGNSGSNLEVTWTPPSTSTKYVYVCYLHFRFSLGGQWGWQPEFTSNNWTSKTGIGNHPSFGNEYPNDVIRHGLVQVGDFHPNTTSECKLGLFATVWSSHSATIVLNGSLQKSRIFLYEVADPQSNFSGI